MLFFVVSLITGRQSTKPFPALMFSFPLFVLSNSNITRFKMQEDAVRLEHIPQVQEYLIPPDSNHSISSILIVRVVITTSKLT